MPMLEGKCLLFDDSFLHEAENNSEERPRVVLIVDVWHPDLTDEEVLVIEQNILEVFIYKCES